MSAVVTISDFGKICRICLKENSDLISIFHSNILTSFSKFTAIKVQADDGLPKEVCPNCVYEANECAKFKQLCENSEKYLRQLLLEGSTENKDWFEITNQIEEQTPDEQDKNQIKIESSNVTIENSSNDDEHFHNNNSENSDNENFKESNITKDEELLSVRQARTTWVMSLEPEKCDTSKFLCKLCDKTLVNLGSLARHMETHDANRQVVAVCEICKKGFYEKGNYVQHMRRHNGEMKYKCKKCTKEFYELNLLTRHLRKIHKIKPINCTECNRTFTLQEQYDIHIKIHKKDYQYFCKYCNKGYFLERKLNEHIRTHDNDKFRKYTCEHCSKVYQHNQSLKKHIERHHTKIQKKDNCDICGITVFNLKEHYLCKHSIEKPHQCTECPRNFATELLLRCHKKIKHEKLYAGKKALCNICGLQSFSKYHLQIHMRTHGEEKPFKCTVCDKTFKSPVGLRAHKTTHTEQRPYTCLQCNKGFKQRKALNRHVIIHTGERPFICNVCDKRFNEKSILNRHMNVHSIHSGTVGLSTKSSL